MFSPTHIGKHKYIWSNKSLLNIASYLLLKSNRANSTMYAITKLAVSLHITLQDQISHWKEKDE